DFEDLACDLRARRSARIDPARQGTDPALGRHLAAAHHRGGRGSARSLRLPSRRAAREAPRKVEAFGMTVAAPPRWEVLYAEAHAERFRCLAGAGAEFLRGHGMLAVKTGALSNVDNGIVLEREDVDDAVLADLVEFLQVPASLICSGFDASDDLRERLAQAGL